MTQEVGDILRDIVTAHGTPIIDDPRRLRALLSDLAAGRTGEISLVLSAAEAQVPHKLLDPGGAPAPLIEGRLAQDLQTRLFITGSAAQWAVQTWAFALGLSPTAPAAPGSAPPQTPPGHTGAPSVVGAATWAPGAAASSATPAPTPATGRPRIRPSLLYSFDSHLDEKVYSVAFSPDGDLIWADFSTARLLDISSGREIVSFRCSSHIRSMALSADGETLATGELSRARIWDVETGRAKAVLKLGFGEDPRALALSPDKAVLATGGLGPKATLWHVPTQRRLTDLNGKGSVNGLGFSPDGKILAIGQATLRLWDTAAERDIGALTTGDHDIQSLAFSPDGALLATGGTSKAAEIWDVADLRRTQVVEGHSDSVNSVAFSPDGTILATASEDGTACLWDVATARQLGPTIGRQRQPGIKSVAFSGDGAMLAVGRNMHGGVQVWRLR